MSVPAVKRVLIADDSAFMRKLITEIISSHPGLEVAGTARNGLEAVKKVRELSPDVMTLDIEMPLLDGLGALQQIMKEHPLPVVMLSSTTKEGAENTIRAMEYGAADFITKPGGAISLNLRDSEEQIVSKVYDAAQIDVKKITGRRTAISPAARKTPVSAVSPHTASPVRHTQNAAPGSVPRSLPRRMVIIGTSTGGPRALQQVLTSLPATIGVPILIVQHMPAGFTKSLADRLDSLCDIHVKEAENGELIEKNTAYIAPGGYHMKLARVGVSYAIRLDAEEAPRMGHRPAVDVLLESAAEFPEIDYTTAIMTGMGHDGLAGMQQLKSRCRTYTIAESEETAVVYGMPRAIAEAGLADVSADVQQIGKLLSDQVKS
ncbi:chemotaxis response regulator protein-glutamate methylesterase [Sporosarcina sp. NCCP-2716]|uniref:protein-glutamate methylesterase/protein-glutamine glutaminase n=1 Tax=Sporosarcina sp. NCCP-2716 TaxID=2943679 RepID=UPI00203BEA6E|nr:chemotaxis response regulator protein-glutamate methylesterase [Sporosarcina sp. NCCP-2716]GKV67818.1 chemotaxis response regulator protein-glutamate methylesterase [Sporosarcina sp. NCCP-2716]